MKFHDFMALYSALWLAFAAGLAVGQAWGDDTESDLGLCLRGYKDHCPETKLQHDLQGKLWIWNSLNCSVRDICNVLPNVTNGGCDPNDEAYNLTGRCDPDWYDNGTEDYKPIRVINSTNVYVCFDDRQMYNQYMNSSSGKELPADYPCRQEKFSGEEELK